MDVLQSMKSSVGNNKRFNNLLEVAQIVLLVPHSNAAIERLFSLVNKNKNKSSDRYCLEQDKALSSVLAVKLVLIILTQVQHCVMSLSLIKNYWVWQTRQLLIITRTIQINIHIILAFFLNIFMEIFILLLFLVYHFHYVFSVEHINMFMKVNAFR